MCGFDFDKPEHYAFGMSILDGGMTFQTLNRTLKDIDLFFHKEPVYNNVYVNNEVTRKQVDTIIILRADKIREFGYHLGEEYDNLEERESLNHIKEIAVELAVHRIDVVSELISKLLERHIGNSQSVKQFILNV
jgi:hypothetical protein